MHCCFNYEEKKRKIELAYLHIKDHSNENSIRSEEMRESIVVVGMGMWMEIRTEDYSRRH